jgi:hypothetical protein
MIPPFPTLVTRAGKGAPLLDSEVDANWTNIRSYCLTLANIVASSLNPDGTLTANSVGAAALQAAAVTLASLNPSLLYSIVPVDTDTGATNAYAITAKGGLGGTNLVPGGAMYDSNGNYVLTGLTLNYGYFWTPGTHDQTCAPANQTALTASNAFTAGATTVTLTGQAGATVTATVDLVAPISAYKNGQIFFVYTANANAGSSTLNVNNLGAIPIKFGGNNITANTITANSIFAVIYEAGVFILFSGGSSSSTAGNGSSTSNYTFSGISSYTTGQVALPGASANSQFAHGLSALPTSVSIYLKKIASDSTTVAVGELVPGSTFQISGAPAFTVAIDATYITVYQGASATPSLNGTAITAASLQLLVSAQVIKTVSTTVFPALTYLVTQPQGAFSYGNVLVVLNRSAGDTLAYSNAINLTNNEITNMLRPYPLANDLAYVNAMIWTRSSGAIQAVFTCNYGVYYCPLVNPNTNLIATAQLYDASTGIYSQSITASTAYTLTSGQNDLSYSFDNVTYTNFTPGTPVNFTSGSGSPILYLKGNPGGTVTASLVTAATTWQATQTGITNGSYYNYKPVWLVESSGTITDVYVVTGNYSAGQNINGVLMYHMTSSTVTSVGSLDFTNSGIVNAAAFAAISPSTSNRILFFQYNPISKRIYITTNGSSFLHIFKITGTTGGAANDISALWAGIVGSTVTYASLTYVKSIAISGDGAPIANPSEESMYIEINQTNGAEAALVFSRTGNTSLTGSVTRIPWAE